MTDQAGPLAHLPKPWLATSQCFWESQIYIGTDGPSRDWYHVLCAALARCGPNLHAQFKQGELAMLLGRRKNNTFEPMNSQRLTNLIAENVKRGTLAHGSGQYCLRLPPGFFGTGLPGADKSCDTCKPKISKPRRHRVTQPGDNSLKSEIAKSQVTTLPVNSHNVSINCANVNANVHQSA